METTKKLTEIIKRRNFQSFWECFDYLKLASYSEAEALMISLDTFKGDIWSKVITSAKRKEGRPDVMVFSSGASYTSVFASSGSTTINGALYGGVDVAQPDDITVSIYVITDKANENYRELYKSYIETRIYEEIVELESHFKIIITNLTSELAIRLFNDGYKKQ